MLKKINETMILDLVRQEGPISRADIAKALQISRPTISKLVGELVNRRVIVEIGEGQSKGGKRPILLQLNRNMHLIGIHLSYPSVKLAIVDNLGNVLVRQELATPGTFQEMMDVLINASSELLHSAGITHSTVAAVSVAVAGITDARTGRIVSSRNFPFLVGTGLKAALQRQYRVPILIDNDVYMGVYGEAYALSAASGSSLAFVRIDNLIGLGMWIDGRVYRGSQFAAGEIGDMLVSAERQLASGYSQEGGYFERWMNERQGEDLDYKIACCLANIVCLFAPDRLFIGGELLIGRGGAIDRINTILKRINGRAPQLETARFGVDAELIGSIYAAVDAIRQNVKIY
ncbi:ROK family transcriptional regulator [Paenibacillus roseipurpureus]|uniref:ROK family transcriptional regulator n=1 Tax=Paenibacillus roseopurpureus TaxID=2918901 RepID=A0AA96RMT9_9BACL|nr:ROK family transcriptional regulator [Paenibacillus sp. MBLB1832]WNR46836.1 ROK family transcriptional regulator [Paenibacillus sp. MBLB1832]